MDISYLDQYLRRSTENEILRNNMNSPELTWDFWKSFPSSDGVLIIKQDRYMDVPVHRHPWFELVYMYDGSAVIVVEEQKVCLKKGECLLINRGSPHFCKACGENDILLNILISRGYLNQNFFNRFSEESCLSRFFINALNDRTETESCIFFPSGNRRRLPFLVREFLCEYYDRTMYSRDYLDSFMTLILLELADVFRNRMNRSSEKDGENQIIHVLRFIEENYLVCTLKSTAEFFNMNSNYLSNYIKKKTGYTFTSFVQNQRLNCAANLLRNTEISVKEVSEMSGYENVSFFYKKFVEKFRCSPGEYRTFFLENKTDKVAEKIKGE